MNTNPTSTKSAVQFPQSNLVSNAAAKPAVAPAPKAAADKFVSGPAPVQVSPTTIFRAPDWSAVAAEKTGEPNFYQLHYTVAQGDTLESIAAKLGTTADELREFNWDAPDPSKVTPGQKLSLPTTYRYAKTGDTWAALAG